MILQISWNHHHHMLFYPTMFIRFHRSEEQRITSPTRVTYYITYPSKNNGSKCTRHYEFMAFLLAKSWRRKANLPLARVENSIMAPFLVTSASDELGSCKGSEAGLSVNRNSFSIRMIWLKLGRIFGSSTQHDWIIKASSGGMSSGRAGLSCCILKILILLSYEQGDDMISMPSFCCNIFFEKLNMDKSFCAFFQTKSSKLLYCTLISRYLSSTLA